MSQLLKSWYGWVLRQVSCECQQCICKSSQTREWAQELCASSSPSCSANEAAKEEKGDLGPALCLLLETPSSCSPQWPSKVSVPIPTSQTKGEGQWDCLNSGRFHSETCVPMEPLPPSPLPHWPQLYLMIPCWEGRGMCRKRWWFWRSLYKWHML